MKLITKKFIISVSVSVKCTPVNTVNCVKLRLLFYFSVIWMIKYKGPCGKKANKTGNGVKTFFGRVFQNWIEINCVKLKNSRGSMAPWSFDGLQFRINLLLQSIFSFFNYQSSIYKLVLMTLWPMSIIFPFLSGFRSLSCYLGWLSFIKSGSMHIFTFIH